MTTLSKFKSFIIVWLCFVGIPSLAENCSCRASQFEPLSEISSLLVNASFIRDHVPKYSAEFAGSRYSPLEMDRRYGATGSIECEGIRIGSANVVGRRDVLITAQHVLWDTTTCKQRKDCKFITSFNNKRVERGIASSFKKAMSCPLNASLDWDVATLSSGVPDGIDPYQLGDSQAMSSQAPTLAVNGLAADFYEYRSGQIAQDRAGRDIQPKSFSQCQWDPDGKGSPFDGLIATNCSAALQSSGSPLLSGDSREVVGIVSRTMENLPTLHARVDAGDQATIVKPCDFNTTNCATLYRPIDGDFRAAVEAAINSTGI